VHQFFGSTFENWQSEWLQLIFQAILLLGAKHWLFRADDSPSPRLTELVSPRRTFLTARNLAENSSGKERSSGMGLERRDRIM
jgi:hypothetical protein